MNVFIFFIFHSCTLLLRSSLVPSSQFPVLQPNFILLVVARGRRGKERRREGGGEGRGGGGKGEGREQAEEGRGRGLGEGRSRGGKGQGREGRGRGGKGWRRGGTEGREGGWKGQGKKALKDLSAFFCTGLDQGVVYGPRYCTTEVPPKTESLHFVIFQCIHSLFSYFTVNFNSCYVPASFHSSVHLL